MIAVILAGQLKIGILIKRGTMKMDNNSVNIVGGVILILIGVWFAIFNKNAAKSTREFNSKFFRFKVGETEFRTYRIGFIVAGILGIFFGIFVILGIIH